LNNYIVSERERKGGRESEREREREGGRERSKPSFDNQVMINAS
jgi:hypothetical protein